MVLLLQYNCCNFCKHERKNNLNKVTGENNRSIPKSSSNLKPFQEKYSSLASVISLTKMIFAPSLDSSFSYSL